MANNQFDAVINSISDEVHVKSNGREFLRCVVTFKSGPLVGKSYHAQRTLGENKAPISVGQNVQCLMNVVDSPEGKRLFFEISTGAKVDDANELLALLGA